MVGAGTGVALTLAEPVVYLAADADVPAQVRGSVELALARTTRVRDIVLSFSGVSRTDWPEGIGRARMEQSESVRLVRLEAGVLGACELRAGTHAFPFSWSLPPGLPPTLHADFGHIEYVLRACVRRGGALAPNLSTQTEVTLVQAPDPATEPLVIERACDDMLAYTLVVGARSVPIGTRIPLTLRCVPLSKVRVLRLVVALEEATEYYANARRVVRHELPRKWTLMHLAAGGGALLPAADAAELAHSPVGALVEAAAARSREPADVRDAPLRATGPWELALDPLVSLDQRRINISSMHGHSNTAVQHTLRVVLRVERADAQRRIVDMVMAVPIELTHSKTAAEWLALPTYAAAARGTSPPPPAFS